MSRRGAHVLSAQLEERAALIATEVLERNRFALALLPETDRRSAEAIVRAVAARLVAEPRSRLAKLDGDPIAAAQLAALSELFGLGEPAAGQPDAKLAAVRAL